MQVLNGKTLWLSLKIPKNLSEKWRFIRGFNEEADYRGYMIIYVHIFLKEVLNNTHIIPQKKLEQEFTLKKVKNSQSWKLAGL